MTVVQIRFCDIPEYLHVGDFYRNLDTEDPEEIIEVLLDCFHADGNEAADLEEFRQLLRVMVFWVLDEIPFGILEYCNEQEVGVWKDGVTDLPDAVEMEIQPVLIKTYSRADAIPIQDIIETGRWELICHAVDRMNNNDLATKAAAIVGDLRTLKYLHDKGFDWHRHVCLCECQWQS